MANKKKPPLSRRCSTCNVNWKPHRKTCPDPNCAGENLWDSFVTDPDEDEAFDAMAKERFLPIVVEFAGLLWMPHDGLVESGQDYLESFDVVVDDEDELYELQGHVRDKSGETGGMWWVEKVVVPDAPA